MAAYHPPELSVLCLRPFPVWCQCALQPRSLAMTPSHCILSPSSTFTIPQMYHTLLGIWTLAIPLRPLSSENLLPPPSLSGLQSLWAPRLCECVTYDAVVGLLMCTPVPRWSGGVAGSPGKDGACTLVHALYKARLTFVILFKSAEGAEKWHTWSLWWSPFIFLCGFPVPDL